MTLQKLHKPRGFFQKPHRHRGPRKTPLPPTVREKISTTVPGHFAQEDKIRPGADVPVHHPSRTNHGEFTPMVRKMIAARAWCETCDWELDAKNGEAVAAQHARKYRHKTVVELSYANTFDHTS